MIVDIYGAGMGKIKRRQKINWQYQTALADVEESHCKNGCFVLP